MKLLAETPTDAAAQVISDVVVGDYRDLDSLQSFAQGCDVVTFDHEHVPTDHIKKLATGGVAVHPGADALVYAQDKLRMRLRWWRSDGTWGGRSCSRAHEGAMTAGECGWSVNRRKRRRS